MFDCPNKQFRKGSVDNFHLDRANNVTFGGETVLFVGYIYMSAQLKTIVSLRNTKQMDQIISGDGVFVRNATPETIKTGTIAVESKRGPTGSL